MKPVRMYVLVASVACSALAGLYVAHNWYYRRYVWPCEIQQQLLGGLLAPSNSLLEYDGYSHYGQGAFRWRYKVEQHSKLLGKLCGNQRLDQCVFHRTRMLSDDLTQSVSYRSGVLTVEEDWT
jgi:hypothetical protein